MAQQKKSELESELNELRYTIDETKKWGYDQIEFNMTWSMPIKCYLGLIVIAFCCIGLVEELSG